MTIVYITLSFPRLAQNYSASHESQTLKNDSKPILWRNDNKLSENYLCDRHSTLTFIAIASREAIAPNEKEIFMIGTYTEAPEKIKIKKNQYDWHSADSQSTARA